MLAKLFQIAIFGLWAVLSTQLIHSIYFRDRSAINEVPAKLVLEQFLKQDESAVDYAMYQRGKKLGRASISIRELRPEVHSLTLIGRVDENPYLITSKAKYSWDSTLILENIETVQSVRLLVRMTQPQIDAEITSSHSSQELAYEIRHAGTVLFSSKKTPVNQLLGSALGGSDPSQLMAAGVMSALGIKVPDKNSPAAVPNATIKGKSSTILAGGQYREVYILSLEPVSGQVVEMIFNRAGQLMMVKAPSEIELRSQEWFPEP